MDRPFYESALDKPLEQITEDLFLRADAFEDAPWYEEFQMFRHIGVCQPQSKHLLNVQKALKMMGYTTHLMERNGGTYVVPGEAPPQKVGKDHEPQR